MTPTTMQKSCYKSNSAKTNKIFSFGNPPSTDQAEDEYDTMNKSRKSRSFVKWKRD